MYTTNVLVRFGDLDPAGIVYYPRLVDFLHRAFEDFFGGHVGRPYPEVIRSGIGFPTVRLEVDFLRPLRHGDLAVIAVGVEHVGRTSMRFRYEGRVGDETAFRARNTAVSVDLATLRPVPTPEWLRERLDSARVGATTA
jgi:YbgC/YbaW family acyl-CoA thioester hydrolase